MSDDSEWESIFITQSTYNVDGTTDKANDTGVILSNLLNLEGKKENDDVNSKEQPVISLKVIYFGHTWRRAIEVTGEKITFSIRNTFTEKQPR